MENSGIAAPSVWFVTEFLEGPGGYVQTQKSGYGKGSPGLRRYPIWNVGFISRFLTDPMQILGQIFKET